jgi:DNA-binding NarL/FixJ family response regulator
VLKLIADGATNREIGTRLNLLEKQVRDVVATTFGKLGVSDRAQAVIRGLERRIL